MDYDTSLITGAQIVDHTGVQDLANLVTDAELVLNTFALNAHRAIWRKLKARGIDPTALSNESLLKDAVAYEAVGRATDANAGQRRQRRCHGLQHVRRVERALWRGRALCRSRTRR